MLKLVFVILIISFIFSIGSLAYVLNIPNKGSINIQISTIRTIFITTSITGIIGTITSIIRVIAIKNRTKSKI